MPRTLKLLLSAALVPALCATHTPAQTGPQPTPARAAADDAVERGKLLYRRGDAEGAIAVLRPAAERLKNDADAWYYLGLALNRRGRAKDARKAFERAADLRPDFSPAHVGLAYTLMRTNKLRDAEREARRALALDANSAEAHYVLGVVRLREDREGKAVEEADAALKINPNFAAALLLKSSAMVGLYLEEYDAIFTKYPFRPRQAAEERERARAARLAAQEAIRPTLVSAVESLKKVIELEPASPEAPSWREQLETLSVYARASDSAAPPGPPILALGPNEGTTKAVILSKPEPGYPDSARQDGVTGVVRLRAVLASDGEVKYIFPLRSPDYRLTQASVSAARKIKFTPATKDGRPVSQFIVLEYNFNIY